MENNNPANGIKWDLTHLYSSINDPKIKNDLKSAQEKALSFEKKYKPLFAAFNADSFPMPELIKDYEAIVFLLTKPGVYAHLCFAGKTDDVEIGAFMQSIETESTEIESHLLFWDVAWNQLPKKDAEKIMQRDSLKDYRHFLEDLRVYAPHTLSEGEEKIMSYKSNTGSSAFSRLFDEVLNNIRFEIELGGKVQEKTESEILDLFHSRHRDLRAKASDSLAQGLSKNSHLLTYIYNMILADHRLNCKIRKYDHPMTARNLSNETSLGSIQNLIQSVQNAYPISHRYYRIKKQLLGLDELFDYDRYAPLPSEEETFVSWKECREIVLEGYYDFDEKAGQIAERFFDEKWIDAELRPGKQGGGFCCQTTPDLHPYILVNYTGNMREVMTVAHEIGHGIHQLLAGNRVGLLESHAPLTLAETASVFGEMLIFDKLLKRETDPNKRLALLCGKIDDNFATVFRQICMTRFELMAHEAGIEKGELSAETLSNFWIQANQEFYGDTITLSENYRQGWKYIPHFVHTPFYCYAYSFAQLFVLSLYQKYTENPADFIPRYFEMLSLGGSKKPEEIAKIVGFDLNSDTFWLHGVNLLDSLVVDIEKLVSL